MRQVDLLRRDHVLERRVESVVQVAHDKAVIVYNVGIHFSPLRLERPRDVLHHFVSLNPVVLTMQKVTAREIKVEIIVIEVNLDGALVAEHLAHAACFRIRCDFAVY